jgi:hypothetical protein
LFLSRSLGEHVEKRNKIHRQRIKRPKDHLTIIDADELLRRASEEKSLPWACRSHLSEENNRSDVALKTHHVITLGNVILYVADRYQSTTIFTVL